jgi:hypothetical protein
MSRMKQLARSTIAWAVTAVWLTQPGPALCEVQNGNRVIARDNPAGIGTGGTDSLSVPKSILPPAQTSERDAYQQTMTPLGVPVPPHQLTPAPLLPFHPNRPLMPSTAVPPNPPLGGGRFGR